MIFLNVSNISKNNITYKVIETDLNGFVNIINLVFRLEKAVA